MDILTLVAVHQMLNEAKEKAQILMTVDNLRIKYKGIIEDTVNGKREVYYIEREVK